MKVAVIGAGPAGATAAYELAKNGIEVDIFEAGPSVGGLATSFPLWDQTVDIGPHRFFSNDARVKVSVIETITTGSDIYLVWAMEATFTPIRKPVTSNTIGMTHLRFNSAGQIVLQQDFWDSTAGFYQHVPLIGPVIRNIGGRFTYDD